jgi:hypothetical protein
MSQNAHCETETEKRFIKVLNVLTITDLKLFGTKNEVGSFL